MTDALTKPVTIAFDTEKEARDFRDLCYNKRRALRLVGVNSFDTLMFKINRNMLTIVKKGTKINAII